MSESPTPTPPSSSHASAGSSHALFMNESTVSTVEPSVSIVSDWSAGIASEKIRSAPFVVTQNGSWSSVAPTSVPVVVGASIARTGSVSAQPSFAPEAAAAQACSTR